MNPNTPTPEQKSTIDKQESYTFPVFVTLSTLLVSAWFIYTGFSETISKMNAIGWSIDGDYLKFVFVVPRFLIAVLGVGFIVIVMKYFVKSIKRVNFMRTSKKIPAKATAIQLVGRDRYTVTVIDNEQHRTYTSEPVPGYGVATQHKLIDRDLQVYVYVDANRSDKYVVDVSAFEDLTSGPVVST